MATGPQTPDTVSEMLSALLMAHLVHLAQGSGHQYSSQLKSHSVYDTSVYTDYLPECGQGEYLNLCGECVSGNTEKEDGFGKDSCGVCGGWETCRGGCSDPQDLLDEGDFKGCTKLISMPPSVLDLEESVNGSICIFGNGVSPQTVKDLYCIIKKEESIIDAQVLDDMIQLSFPLPSREGSYDLYCNTSTGVEYKQDVLVVDSKSLVPTAVDKSSLSTWVENQVTVTVSKMAGPADLLCFARTSSGELLFAEWTRLVAGNSLSTTVECPPFVPTRPGPMEYGVAYSIPGAKSAKALKVKITANAPKPLEAIFRPDISELTVYFDQNLEEDIKGCPSLFTSDSVTLLEKASSCFVSANQVHITLRGSVMKNNTVISFKDQAVTTMFSKAKGGGRVVVHVRNESKEVMLEERRRLCKEKAQPVASSEMQTVAVPNWKVAGQIPIGQRQRLNLMAWRAARASRKAQTTNSTTITPEMKHNVPATVNDSIETQVSGAVILPDFNETWLQLAGPSALDVQEYSFFIATPRSCGTPLRPTRYKWKVASDTDTVETHFANGHRLTLPPGTLLPGSKYTLSVQAFLDEEPTASESVDVKTFVKNSEIHLQDAKIVVGNGHSLEIDASTAIESKLIKLKWTCKKGYCYAAGKEKKPLDSLESFSQRQLTLPAKTLVIGRYLFALETTCGSTKIGEAEVEVLVVSGEPPYISSLNIKEEVSAYVLRVEVSEIRQRCRLFWAVVPRVGYSHINVPENSLTMEGSLIRPQSAEMNLSIDKNSLTPGSKSILRATADCGRVAQSHREFRFFVPDGMNGARLEVEPVEGQALVTEFVYRLVEGQATAQQVHSFGYLEGNNLKILNTDTNREFKTYLGCCKFKTAARVCRTRNNCVTVYGPEVQTTPPLSLNTSIIRRLADSNKEQLMSANYEEALSNLKMILPVLKGTDLSAYEEISQKVQEVIVERIKIHTDRLQTDKDCLQESLKLLDFTSDIMASMSLSEQSMAAILQFRDLVHTSARLKNEKMNENKISENMPPEPRPSFENGNLVRHRRGTENPKPMIAVETALRSAMQFLRRLSDDSEAARKERSKLLDLIIHSSIKQSGMDAGLHQVENTIDERIDVQKLPDFIPYSVKENLRRKRGAEDPGKNTIKVMKTVLKITLQSIKKISNNSEGQQEEKHKLISYINDYSRDLCNKFSTPQVIGSGQDPIKLGVVQLKLNETEKVKFPFCSSQCLNPTILLNVSFADYYLTTSRTQDVCIAMGSLKDDIFSNLSSSAMAPIGVRQSAVYWLKVMRYEHGVVPRDLYNISSQYHPMGQAVIQFPVSSDPNSKGKILQCWMFNPSGWNTTACIKIKETTKENITSVQCQCSFPGFYSIFAVNKMKTDRLDGIEIKIPSPPTPTSSTKAPADTLPVINTSTSPSTATVLVATPSTATESAIATKKAITIANISSANPQMTTSTPIQKIQGSDSTISLNHTLYTVTPTYSVVTQPPDGDVRTVPNIFQPYKYSATFSINESYVEEVGEMKEKFEEHIEDQLQKNLNMSESVTVDAEEHKAKITVTLRIPENKLQEVGTAIMALKDHLKNGSLVLMGLHENRLDIPTQDIILKQQGSAAKSAITAFVTIVFIFLVILIGSVLAAFYLRNSREQHTIRMTQDLHSDPPAPKYLRLHDSVSIDSSGPSTPQTTEMESSLAVLTRPQRRGYETMESFSHFPGNI